MTVTSGQPRCLVMVGRFPSPYGWVEIAIEVAPRYWLDYHVTEALERQVNAKLPQLLDLQRRCGVQPRTGYVSDFPLDTDHRVALMFWPVEDGANMLPPGGILH